MVPVASQSCRPNASFSAGFDAVPLQRRDTTGSERAGQLLVRTSGVERPRGSRGVCNACCIMVYVLSVKPRKFHLAYADPETPETIC